jgi:hypothetical protein
MATEFTELGEKVLNRGDCECVSCCDGEHPGSCKDCAGWGELSDDESDCEHCEGTGICPVCNGDSRQAEVDMVEFKKASIVATRLIAKKISARWC